MNWFWERNTDPVPARERQLIEQINEMRALIDRFMEIAPLAVAALDVAGFRKQSLHLTSTVLTTSLTKLEIPK